MRAIRLVAAMNLALLAACAQSSQPPCGQRCQDDTTLREQFAIPKAAHLIAYSSQLQHGGWFGREGLKLELVYQLNQSDDQRYQANATSANGWHRFRLHKPSWNGWSDWRHIATVVPPIVQVPKTATI